MTLIKLASNNYSQWQKDFAQSLEMAPTLDERSGVKSQNLPSSPCSSRSWPSNSLLSLLLDLERLKSLVAYVFEETPFWEAEFKGSNIRMDIPARFGSLKHEQARSELFYRGDNRPSSQQDRQMAPILSSMSMTERCPRMPLSV